MRPAHPLPQDGPAAAGSTAGRPIGAQVGLSIMVVVWAVNFSVIKIGLESIPPLAFNALRFPAASIFVWAVLRARGPIPRPDRGDIARLIALGVLGNVVYQGLFISGLDRTRAGNAALLLAGSPIFTALLSSAVGHERTAARTWVGVLATVAGMALVVIGGAGDLELGLDTLAGDLLMVGASAAWSIYTVGARAPIHRYGSVAVTAWTLWIGTLGVVAIGAPSLAAVEWAAVPRSAWAAVLYAGIFGIGLAYLLWYGGVRRIGNTRTAAFSNLVPVLALGVAWLWLGEVPGMWQVVGAAVIIGGVTLAQR